MEANIYIPILISVIAALATVGASWLTVRVGRKKADADAVETLTDVALSLVKPLKVEIEILKEKQAELMKKIVPLEEENAILHRWSQLLFSQVVEAGQEPIPFSQVKYWEKE